MAPIHLCVLEAALGLANRRTGWTFRLRDVVAALPELHAPTVRTHVASRCCVNAPSHHQSRYAYFRSVGRGTYVIEPPFRKAAGSADARGWQDAILATIDSGIDPTLIDASLALAPTERLEWMRAAAESLDAMRRR